MSDEYLPSENSEQEKKTLEVSSHLRWAGFSGELPLPTQSVLFWGRVSGRLGSVLLGASALSDRSPVFVKLLFREGRVKVVRFIFESTYQAEQEEFVEGLSATREVCLVGCTGNTELLQGCAWAPCALCSVVC